MLDGTPTLDGMAGHRWQKHGSLLKCSKSRAQISQKSAKQKIAQSAAARVECKFSLKVTGLDAVLANGRLGCATSVGRNKKDAT